MRAGEKHPCSPNSWTSENSILFCSHLGNLQQHFVQFFKNPFIRYAKYVKALLFQLNLAFPVLIHLAPVNADIQFNEQPQLIAAEVGDVGRAGHRMLPTKLKST